MVNVGLDCCCNFVELHITNQLLLEDLTHIQNQLRFKLRRAENLVAPVQTSPQHSAPIKPRGCPSRPCKQRIQLIPGHPSRGTNDVRVRPERRQLRPSKPNAGAIKARVIENATPAFGNYLQRGYNHLS